MIHLHLASLREKIELLKLQLKGLKTFSPEYNKISDCFIKMLKLAGVLTIEQNNRRIMALSQNTGTTEGYMPLDEERLKSMGIDASMIEMIKEMSDD